MAHSDAFADSALLSPTRDPAVLNPIANSTPRSPPPNGTTLNAPASPRANHSRGSSFAENLRHMPSSPRAHRSSSLSQQAVQDLLNNPPVGKNGSSEFEGRDWRSIRVGEIVSPDDVRFVETTTSVEAATNLLISSGSPNVVLLRETAESRTAVGTFDYSDLNAYLLLVVGLAQPDERHVASFNELAQKGREGKPIPLKDVKFLNEKEPLVTLPHTADLTKAVEIFGSGIHRIIIVEEQTTNVVGVLTQLRLVRFFWENGRNFPAVDRLYPHTLKDLDLGSHNVLAINGDKPLSDALELMHNEGITSLPVLDNHRNVVGNISHVDVRLLTKSSSIHLLRSSCLHFISVILSERGMNDGKDSFPVFHVHPYATLAHTVAKLVATRSHRMWIVDDDPSPASSGHATPLHTSHSHAPPLPALTPNLPPAGAPYTPATPPSTSSVGAAAMPGAYLSGRLCGVVSLTDVLNLIARASGLSPTDPDETRRLRRRSSSSQSVRRSMDSSRSESEREGVSRRGSVRGR